MKCPFRTTTKTEQLYSKNGSVTSVEYAECLGGECPYFGRTVRRFSDATVRWETVTEPYCRRVDNEQREAN